MAVTGPLTTQARPALIVLDQLISSGGNLAWMVSAALLLEAEDFGAFSLGWSFVAIAVGGVRYTSSERLVRERVTDRRALITSSWLLVTIISTVGLLGLWAILGTIGIGIWIAACPLVLIQDRLRYLTMSNRPGKVVFADAIWLAVIGLGLVGNLADGLGARSTVVLASVGGPALSAAVLLLAMFPRLDWTIERDLNLVRAEAPFVLDAWIMAAAVFIAQALIGALDSLATVGTVGVLLLLFQPFYSIAYAGRWVVIGARSSERLRRWPSALASVALIYSLAVGAGFWLAHVIWTLPAVWHVGAAAFSIAAFGQVARAFHSGLTDLARREATDGLIAARATFALCLLVTTAGLVPTLGVAGAALSYTLSFLVGAGVAARLIGRPQPPHSPLAS